MNIANSQQQAEILELGTKLLALMEAFERRIAPGEAEPRERMWAIGRYACHALVCAAAERNVPAVAVSLGFAEALGELAAQQSEQAPAVLNLFSAYIARGVNNVHEALAPRGEA